MPCARAARVRRAGDGVRAVARSGVGDEGEGDGADVEYRRERNLGVEGHVHHVRTDLAQSDRLGAGQEAVAGDEGHGCFVIVRFRFRDFAEFGAERVGRRRVLHVVCSPG